MAKHYTELPKKQHFHSDHAHSEEDRPIKYITFFGDSSVSEESKVYKEVFKTAKLLAENEYGVVNGGGPGVMKAATDGAESIDGDTIAVYWEPRLASIFEGKNLANATDQSEAYSNYMMRTLGLIEKGQVYVVCLGGTGTISEFGMVWALAKLYYGRHKPVILFGEFWPTLIKQISDSMLIDDDELGVLHYATTPEEVLKLVKSLEAEVAQRMHKTYEGDETSFILSPKYSAEETKELRETASKHKYNVANYVTKSQLHEFRDLVNPPARVLSVGCPSTYDVKFLSDNYSLTVIGENSQVLQIAQFENPNADVIEADILDYELPKNSYKGVWLRDILHHYHDPDLKALFKKVALSLVTSGIMQVVTREGEGESYEQEVHAGAKTTKFYNYLTEEELSQLATANNLEIIESRKVTRSHNWLNMLLRKQG